MRRPEYGDRGGYGGIVLYPCMFGVPYVLLVVGMDDVHKVLGM